MTARDSARRVLRRPTAALSVAYLALLGLAAALAGILAPYRPDATDLDHVLSGPTAAHPLGTDPLGRDVLSRLMYGGRISITDAAVALVTVLAVGVSAGLAAGFLGGWPDRVLSRAVDVALAVPPIVALLVVLTALGDNQVAAMVTVGVLAAPGLVRVVRASTLTVRGEPYVAAARIAGLSGPAVAVRHVLPRVAGPVVVQGSLFAGVALLIDAGLGYLGFGARPPAPSWGGMIAQAAAVVDRQPWLLVPPGVVLGLAILALGLLGDAVRDVAVDRVAPPRSPRRPAVRPAPPPRPPAPPLLCLRDVSIALPGTGTVVSGVDLDVPAGGTVGLVGESGCGKSLTARAVLGLLPAGGTVTGGGIWFDGTDITAASARRPRGSGIALVGQDPAAALDPVWTVGRQVGELVRRHRGGSRRAVAGRVLELLDEVRLPEPDRVARRHPHELSGGMAQRVAIAMALAGEPDLLIADEPTTALDVAVRAEVLALLRRLVAGRSMALLLISHDWTVVAATCARVSVLYAGQVVESGDTAGLLRAPRHPYTAALLGCAPGDVPRGRPLPAIPGTVPEPAARPAGCRFAPRCALAEDDCRAAPVPLLTPSAGHHTRCRRYERLGGGHVPAGRA